MTRSAPFAIGLRRLAASGALLGLVAIGTTAAPKPAHAWWGHGYGWCCGVGLGIYLPPIVVAPPAGLRPGAGLLRAGPGARRAAAARLDPAALAERLLGSRPLGLTCGDRRRRPPEVPLQGDRRDRCFAGGSVLSSTLSNYAA
jgi:hypothetical protein